MPTQSKEAPGELAIVRGFVNTLDIDEGVENFGTPASLAAWLADHEIMGHGVRAGDHDLERAIALREALREILLSNNDGHPVKPSAPAVLDDAAARASLRLRATAEGGTRLEAEAQGVDGALGRLLIIVYRSMETGTWRRLKACRNDTCLWAFYDHSRNSSGHWCTMDECGSREKARTYRRRRKATGVVVAEDEPEISPTE